MYLLFEASAKPDNQVSVPCAAMRVTGPGMDGDPGQLRAPGDGIVKLVLGNGDPPSTIPTDILMRVKSNQLFSLHRLTCTTSRTTSWKLMYQRNNIMHLLPKQ